MYIYIYVRNKSGTTGGVQRETILGNPTLYRRIAKKKESKRRKPCEASLDFMKKHHAGASQC